MRPSSVAVALVQSFERLKLCAYLPTPDDVPTIGWGATYHRDGTRVRMGETCTAAEADALFDAQFGRVAAEVTGLIGSAPTTQPQFDALCSIAYNIGTEHFTTSTLLRDHRAGDIAGAAESFKAWRFQGKVVLLGLVRRRKAEAALYLSKS